MNVFNEITDNIRLLLFLNLADVEDKYIIQTI